MEYCKINTLFKRDEKNIIIPTEYCMEEFKALENVLWEGSEKLDGTNTRVELEVYQDLALSNPPQSGTAIFKVKFGGKTDNAEIPSHLYAKLEELFSDVNWNMVFPDAKHGDKITLFGEGYGVKIQKGGNYIRNGVNFSLFDVKYNQWWLNRASCEDIANKLKIDIVPFLGYMTIPEAIEKVKKGFLSTIAENKQYMAEGIVLKAPCGLLARNGERLITKIKTKDFIKLERKLLNDAKATGTQNS